MILIHNNRERENSKRDNKNRRVLISSDLCDDDGDGGGFGSSLEGERNNKRFESKII